MRNWPGKNGADKNMNLIVVGLLWFGVLSGLAPAQEQKAIDLKPSTQAGPRIFLGLWEGFLEMGRGKVQFVFEIRENNEKGLFCLIQAPTLGISGIEAQELSISGKTIKFTFPMVNFKFEGVLSDDRPEIEGAFIMRNSKIAAPFKKVDSITTVKRRQTPTPPYPYEESDVRFLNNRDGTELAGTLTYPKDGKAFPAVILLSGAGPQDRNEEGFGGHRFFQVLADDLTKRGIAVLRYDDRGCGKSTGNNETATVFDFAGDAESGLDLLRTLPFIDREKIGFIGHSEGGLIAQIIAGNRRETAFIVLMAGPIMPQVDILKYQNRGAVQRGAGPDMVALSDRALEIVFREEDVNAIRTKLTSLFMNANLPPEAKKSMVEYWGSPDMIFIVKTNPADYLAKVKCPVLALGGARDAHIPARENLEALKRIMTKIGNSDYETVEFPDMNHLFQTTKNGAISEYPLLEETMSPVAMKTIGEWVLKTVSKKKRP